MNYWYLMLLIWQSHIVGAMNNQDDNPLERIRRNSSRKHKVNARKQKQ